MAVEVNPVIISHAVQMKAEADPDHRVYTFENPTYGDREVTHADLWTHSNRLAAYFAERGLGKGDTVAILMRNYPEFIYAMIAAAISGVVLVPIDPRTKGAKLVYQFNNSESKLVLCTADLYEKCAAAADGTQLQGSLVYTLPDQSAPGGDGVEDLAGIFAADRPTLDQQVDDINAPLQIIYTSGTTGDPKGVVVQMSRLGMVNVLATAVFGYEPEHVLYTGLSLTHGNAQFVTAFPAIFLGNHAVISERFTKSRLWDIARKFNVTTFSNLGGILTGLYGEPEKPDDADNPVEYVISAGTPHAIWEQFEQRFGVKILEWYGAVEGGLAYKPIGQGPTGSFGKPIAGVLEMKVVREDDTECDPHEVGEIVSRPASGENSEVEYYKNPEASKKKVAGGWLRSGDMAHCDEDGWFFFDFRKGGGLRHNGDFVSPDYVERAVCEHEQVSDAFVYGVPAASGAPGEKDVIAAVVPFPGATIDVGSLYKKCRADLEANFVPTYIQVVDEIPKTISEKPQERFLLEAFSPDADNVFTEAG